MYNYFLGFIKNILRFALNPVNFDQGNADTDCDEEIDIIDALLIAQYYVGLINVFC